MSDAPPTAADRTRVLVVVAHPDDETFGLGSVIARAVHAGAEVVVCCATRGEAGESDVPVPDGQTLGDVREAELRAAGQVLGVSRHVLLGFADSGMEGDAAPDSLAGAPLAAVVDAVRAVVDDVRPQVVVSLDVVTSDGHRDHDRIGAATVAAVADHPDVLLYAWCVPRPVIEQWFAHLALARPDSPYAAGPVPRARPPDGAGDDGPRPAALSWTLRVRASAAHASQRPPFDGMPADLTDLFLGTDHLVRLQPPWAGGDVERSLPL